MLAFVVDRLADAPLLNARENLVIALAQASAIGKIE
jgi:hypothetical protein